MSLATKNVATVLVGSVLVLAASFAVATPAKADLLSDLQAQVQALLAQIASLQGGSTTPATGAGCYNFTMTHQMGDTGGEVMWIQQFLNSHGAQVAATGAGSPGNESSYFGALTRAAVAKWQAANGVSPAAGYWGPITRAKVAQVCAGTTPGTTTPGTTTPGGSTGLTGTAGTANITSTSEDVEDVVRTGTTEKVVGFKVEAQGSDLRVTNVRVRFQFVEDTGSESDYLTAFFNEVSIWANGQKIGSMPASSFTRDSAGKYSGSIPVDQIIRMGAANKVTFHVGATAQASVDSEDLTGLWTADVTQVRYTDAVGAVLFENPGSTLSDATCSGTPGVCNAGVEVERLSQSSEVILRMSEGSGNPKAGNVQVSESNSSDVTLAEFTLRAEGSDMSFDRFIATTTTTGVDQVNDIVQTFYLQRGSTRIAEVTPAANLATTSGVITFNLDTTENLSAGSTQTYRIVAKVNTIDDGSGVATVFDQGDTIMLDNLLALRINARASDGKVIEDANRRGSGVTYLQTLRSSGLTAAWGTSSAVEVLNVSDDNTDNQGKYVIDFTVNAFRETAYVPLTAASSSSANTDDVGVAFKVENTSGGAAVGAGTSTAILERVSGGTTQGGFVRIDDGASATFRLTVYYDAAATGIYRVQLGSVGFNQTSAAAPDKELVLTPAEDYESASVQVLN